MCSCSKSASKLNSVVNQHYLMMFYILLCLTLCFFMFLKKRYTYWTTRGVTQDLAVPLFGLNWNLVINKMSNTDIFQYLYNKHSSERYIGVYDFLTPILIIKDPDLIQQVLIKNFEHFMDHRPSIPPDLDPLWNKNVANLKGSAWKDMRSSLSPSFTGSKLRLMFDLMKQCADNFVQHFLLQNEDIVEIEVRETFSRYINDVIASTCFGYQCDSLIDTTNEFYMKGLEGSYNLGYWRHVKLSLLRVFPWMSKIFTVTKFGEDVTNFFRETISANVEFRRSNNLNRPDMITLLLQASKDEGTVNGIEINEDSSFSINEIDLDCKKKKINLSVDDITANAMVFFFAGFSTTTSLLCFMSYELTVNPEIQEKVILEVDTLKREKGTLTYEDINELPYLQMVIAESLRKYPPFCRTDRQCSKPITIQSKKSSESTIKMEIGDNIWIPIYAMHHDCEYWPEPEKFDPERFSPLNKKNITPGTYLPFGIGPRGCMGYRFVLQTIKILYFELLCHFEIVPVGRTVIPCRISKNTSHIIPGSGFWYGFKRRGILF